MFENFDNLVVDQTKFMYKEWFTVYILTNMEQLKK
jgi:hypothetical protein